MIDVEVNCSSNLNPLRGKLSSSYSKNHYYSKKNNKTKKKEQINNPFLNIAQKSENTKTTNKMASSTSTNQFKNYFHQHPVNPLSKSNYGHSISDFSNLFPNKQQPKINNQNKKTKNKNSMTPKPKQTKNKTNKDNITISNITNNNLLTINKNNNKQHNNINIKNPTINIHTVKPNKKINSNKKNSVYKTLLNYSHNVNPKQPKQHPPKTKAQQKHLNSLSNNLTYSTSNINKQQVNHTNNNNTHKKNQTIPHHQIQIKDIINQNKKKRTSTSVKKQTRQITPMKCFKRIHSSTPNTNRNCTPLKLWNGAAFNTGNNNSNQPNNMQLIKLTSSKTPQKKTKNNKQNRQISHSPNIHKNRNEQFNQTDKKLRPTTSTTVFLSHKRNNLKYTYVIFPGNNGKLVEKCLLTRPLWESVDKSQSNYVNLLWTPLSYQINFSRVESICQYVNHIEAHSELSNKMKLFSNLLRHCEFYKQNLFSFFPVTVVFQLSHNLFDEQLEKFKTLFIETEKLLMNTQNSAQENNQTDYPIYISYFNIHLSKRIGSEQKIMFPNTSYNGQNIWLIKPVNLNRGRCIKIHNNIDEIIKDLNTLKEKKTFVDEHNKKLSHAEFVIVQKYIEKPLLYKGRKFDIRIWVLFTDQDEVYVFKEGHLKATSDDYNTQSLNPYLHLTNYSVQKYGENFEKTEKGNEISFEEFQNELNLNKNKEEQIKNFKKDIFPKICNIIKTTALATRCKMNSFINKNAFEIFGYDFLIDSEYNPFLIEINTNPGYEESSPLIKMLLPRMFDDAFRLTIDVVFKRNSENDSYINVSPYEVKGYSNNENMWMKIKC